MLGGETGAAVGFGFVFGRIGGAAAGAVGGRRPGKWAADYLEKNDCSFQAQQANSISYSQPIETVKKGVFVMNFIEKWQAGCRMGLHASTHSRTIKGGLVSLEKQMCAFRKGMEKAAKAAAKNNR